MTWKFHLAMNRSRRTVLSAVSLGAGRGAEAVAEAEAVAVQGLPPCQKRPKRKCRHPDSTAGSRLPGDGRESLEPPPKSRRSKSCRNNRGGEKAETRAPRRKSPSPNPWEQPPPIGNGSSRKCVLPEPDLLHLPKVRLRTQSQRGFL